MKNIAIAELWLNGELALTLRLFISEEIVKKFNTLESLAGMCLEVWGGGETKEGFTDEKAIASAHEKFEKEFHLMLQEVIQKELSIDSELIIGDILLPDDKEEEEGVKMKFDFEIL